MSGTRTPSQTASVERLGAAIGALASPVQVHLRLTGAADIGRLRSAWQSAIENNASLREALADFDGHASVNGSASNGNGYGNVNGNGNGRSANKAGVRVPWHEYDLRGLSDEEMRTWIESFLETDRNQRMTIGRAPSMRCTVIRISDEECELVWSLQTSIAERINVAEIVSQLSGGYGSNLGAQRVTSPGEQEILISEKRESSPTTSHNGTPRIAGQNQDAAESDEDQQVEKQLTAVWASVLKTTSIGRDDDFFDLGGHSLLAARLLAKIEQAMGVELPLASLLEAPTIRGQARLIRKEKGAVHAAGEEGGIKELPFFFLGGDPTFRPLSRRLSEMREFHSLGVQASLIAKLKKRSLEEIAEQFVGMIEERRPKGPYMLGGWCAHGLLAYEVARQLSARGHEVAQVLMLESVNPVRLRQYSGWRRVVGRMQLKVHLLKFETAYLQQLNGAQKKDYVAARASQKFSRIKQSVKEALGKTPETDQGPLDVLYAAASRYYPKPYDGHVALIRSLERTVGFLGRQLHLGWDDVLNGNLEIHETPGNHYTIYMDPNVDTLAEKMNACLKAAEARVSQTKPAVAH